MQQKLEHYFDRLWPVCRSLTGNGNRETLKILSEIIPLEIRDVQSGTKCFDWTIPPEWNIKEAWIKMKGEKIIDFAENNLHLLGYSAPFSGKLPYEELKEHLYTLPEQPDLIPYLTSYYSRRWGFCMRHSDFEKFSKDALFEVHIDSSLNESGSMTIAEAVIRGQSEEEVLLSTYFCHPSMANNELSGPLVSAFLYNKLKNVGQLKYTYRFIFIPETIGSIYYLSQMGEHWKKYLKAGFVITCIGDRGAFTYKKSRRGNALPDRVVELLLEQTEKEYKILDFFPSDGSDERQYCSPGFNLPVGSLMRSMYGKYPEYHTSGDNKNFISFPAMEASINKYFEAITMIERNEFYVNTMPFCEPQLGKRGLYPTLGSSKKNAETVASMMWVLNLADGEHDLIAISRRSGIPFHELLPVVDTIVKNGILRKK
jgi:aminopeptidase-like protein